MKNTFKTRHNRLSALTQVPEQNQGIQENSQSKQYEKLSEGSAAGLINVLHGTSLVFVYFCQLEPLRLP